MHLLILVIKLIKNIKLKECKDWPPYGPDLNPNENIWGIIKSQLMNNEINKRSEFILEIENAYNSISDEMISNLDWIIPK